MLGKGGWCSRGRGCWGLLARAVATTAAAAHGPMFESEFVRQRCALHLPLGIPALGLRAGLGGGQRRGRLVEAVKMLDVVADHI